MLYLFLGYLVAQSFSAINTIVTHDIPLLTILFSVIVFIIWSFAPVIGYAIAKMMGAKGHSNKYVLLVTGAAISLIEHSLFYFDLLTYKDYIVGMLITSAMFFVVAYAPFKMKLTES